MSLTATKIKRIVPTVTCYDSWSSTYDSDENVLQMLDDRAFTDIAEPLVNIRIDGSTRMRHCCELGCGTGRNTVKLIDACWSVTAIDISKRMMEKAKERIKNHDQEKSSSVSWLIHDLNGANKLPVSDSTCDAVLSTLLIEHIESLDEFFQTIYRILKKSSNSWAYITAMHPNMYRAGSQAGFCIDPANTEKVCGVSFDHSIENIVEAAKKSHFVPISVLEKGIPSNHAEAKAFGNRAMKWIGMNIHVSFLFRIDPSHL